MKQHMKVGFYMGPLERAKLLLSKAHDDEVLLEEIVTNDKITDEIIGFHAQQAAEKLLKALLMAREIPYRRTHDLRELIDLISDHNIPFPEALMEVRALSPFAVEFRYDYLPMEDETPFDRNNALEIIKKLRIWVNEKIL